MLSRAAAIEAIAGQRFEVVVIGGGITGAGVALDAASRGYSVALLERGDYADGTSSRSSKMVHGGLRYLQNFDLGLVREALLERQLMVQLAPHLVYPTPVPRPRPRRGAPRPRPRHRPQHVRRDGDDAGRPQPPRDALVQGGGRGLLLVARPPPHDRPRRGAGAGARRWPPRDPKNAYLFYDCQTDDVRLVLTVLGEAERFGAAMLNGAEVTEVLLRRDGRATGVAFVEAESGERIEVGADNVVNATGVFADRIRPEEVVEEEDVPRISPSRGTHVLVDRGRPARPASAACIVPAGEGRAIFALPWYGRTLIGTTDNDFDGDIDHPRPAGDDIAYLLDAVNEFFGVSLGERDLVGAYAGVRPLIATGDPRSRSTSRARPSCTRHPREC